MMRFTITILLLLSTFAVAQTPDGSAAAAPSRAVGTVTAIQGNTFTLKPDNGADVQVSVDESTRLLRTAPGQKDLKQATPIQVSDLQAGDRALVRGKPGTSNPLVAATVIVMKQADVANRQQQEMQEWQRQGVGGMVRNVDANSGVITISAGLNQTLAIQTSGSTEFLRYAPDSVKFSDAHKSSLSEIQSGDQLRARGTRSNDGGPFTANAVISGSFRNIAGTVQSVDSSAGTATISDLATHKPVTVKITADTQMRKIPPQMAQRIAMVLKGGGGSGEAQGPAGRSFNSPGAPAGGRPAGPGGQNGPPDIQRIIRAMPPATLNDLQKGDAVMIVTTEGQPGAPVTALTLLSGVEPILTAAPTQARAADLLSGWSMGGGGEGEQ